MSLKEYKAKRNFRGTAEPAGKDRHPRGSAQPMFVVQKHDASRLHYDFRLEMEGVLKSWAVPKGFPTTRGDRRLAVQVEDHPVEYGGFEGTIPEGSYGGGTVMLWDTGTYEVSGEEPSRALRSGKLHLTLGGKKLKGEWTLVRMRPREGRDEDKPQWLLLKSGGDVPPISKRAEEHSVLTGRSLEQIASAGDREWQSDRAAMNRRRPVSQISTSFDKPRSRRRAEPGASASSRGRRGNKDADGERSALSATLDSNKAKGTLTQPAKAETEIDLHRLPKTKPDFVEPMKALLVDDLPTGQTGSTN